MKVRELVELLTKNSHDTSQIEDMQDCEVQFYTGHGEKPLTVASVYDSDDKNHIYIDLVSDKE